MVQRQLVDDNLQIIDPISQLYAKRFRKQTLDSPLLHRQKIVIPAKRIRRVEDTLMKLKQNKECATYLLERDEFDTQALVFDSKQIFALRRRKDAFTSSYYMDVEGEEIRFTLNEVYTHPLQKWIVQAKLQRYIVGRPNILEIPLNFKPTLDNIRMNRGADFEFKMDSITVISYNDEYPTRLDVDPSNVTHSRGYKIGDLQNSLPPGMFLHKKYQSSLHTNIIKVGGDREKMVEQELKRQQMMEQVNKGVDIEQEQSLLLRSNKPKKVSNKQKKVRSLKKIVQNMSAEIKERLANVK